MKSPLMPFRKINGVICQGSKDTPNRIKIQLQGIFDKKKIFFLLDSNKFSFLMVVG